MEEKQQTQQIQSQQTQPKPIDYGALTLAKAIRQTESNNNYDAIGDNGTSNGAYQWQEATWKNDAKEILGDSNAVMSPENQNAVAYGMIKKWKDQGLNAAQIAAKWNSGSEIGWEKKVGYNPDTNLTYNVPAYVNKVMNTYQQFKAQTPELFNQQQEQTTQPQEQKSLLGFLGNIFSSGANLVGGIGSAIVHPIKTTEAIANTAMGIGEKLIPGEQEHEIYANAIGNYFKERYKSPEALGETIYKDPIGFLADLSTFASGGGAALGKIGELSDVAKATNLAKAVDTAKITSNLVSNVEAANLLKTPGAISKFAQTLTKVGDVTNPLNLVSKPIEWTATGLKNLSTGITKTALPKILSDETAMWGLNNVSFGMIKSMQKQIKDITQSFNESISSGLKGTNIIGTSDDILNSIKEVKLPSGEIKYPYAEFTTKDINSSVTKVLGSKFSKLADKFSKGKATLDELNKIKTELSKKVFKPGIDLHNVKLSQSDLQVVYEGLSEFIKKNIPEELQPIASQQKAATNFSKALNFVAEHKGQSHFVTPEDIVTYGFGGIPGIIAKRLLIRPSTKFGVAKAVDKVSKVTKKTGDIIKSEKIPLTAIGVTNESIEQ